MDQKTKLCPHCRKEVDIMASRCPHCQGKIYMWTTARKIMAGFIVFIFITIIISGINSSDMPSTASQQAEHSDIEICVESEHLLEQFLKSPSTAKFPTCRDTSIKRLGGDKFTVSSYVDSQNSFGAIIRSNWSMTYHYTDNGARTQLDLVTIDGKTMFGN